MEPTKLETNGISIGEILEVTQSLNHALALSSTDTLFAWGSNTNGQLGKYYSIGTNGANTDELRCWGYCFTPVSGSCERDKS